MSYSDKEKEAGYQEINEIMSQRPRERVLKSKCNITQLIHKWCHRRIDKERRKAELNHKINEARKADVEFANQLIDRMQYEDILKRELIDKLNRELRERK